jgi:anti-sigma factor RsiW
VTDKNVALTSNQCDVVGSCPELREARAEIERLRAALERARSELGVEEVDPDDCREAVLAILDTALSGAPSETEKDHG